MQGKCIRPPLAKHDSAACMDGLESAVKELYRIEVDHLAKHKTLNGRNVADCADFHAFLFSSNIISL